MHFQAAMGAKPRTNAAMMANHRQALVSVIANGVEHTLALTAAAPNTLGLIQNHTAALSGLERIGRANLGALGLAAGMTDYRDKAPRKPSASPYANTAFLQRVVLPINSRANQHARKTANALAHLVCF